VASIEPTAPLSNRSSIITSSSTSTGARRPPVSRCAPAS
jgi:hypothetical protein